MCAVATLAAAQGAGAQTPPRPTADGAAPVFAAPEQGGPRRFRVIEGAAAEMRAAPAPNARVLEPLDADALLANFGCARAVGRAWCKVRRLRGRAQGYVPAADLRPARAPDGGVLVGPNDSPRRARQGAFDQTGVLRCAQIKGEPLGDCAFGVARSDGGDATLVVTFSNGFRRTLFFAHGQLIRADTTMSGVGFDTEARRDGDLYRIRVEDQRYRVPVAAISGVSNK